MSMAMNERIKGLEERIRALEEIIRQMATLHVNPNGPRRMCPKCGVKPNYHLHVINCRGPWQGEGAAP